jgi:hypothetical protein
MTKRKSKSKKSTVIALMYRANEGHRPEPDAQQA